MSIADLDTRLAPPVEELDVTMVSRRAERLSIVRCVRRILHLPPALRRITRRKAAVSGSYP